MGEKPWVIDLTKKLSQLQDFPEEAQLKDWEEWKMRSIYKLPSCITDRNKTAYKPQLVSFGPYHHNDSNPMEYHKERTLLHFLNRSGKSLECYVEALGEVVQDLKGAYDSRWLESEWNSDEFLKLMIRDGCFMLEILRTFSRNSHNEQYVYESDYTSMDPIFGYHGRLFWKPHITSDMVMLENQLPMLLLEKLHAVGNPDIAEEDRRKYINKLVQKFYYLRPEKLGKCMHVLDVYRKRLLWESPSQDQAQDQGICLTKIINTLKSCLPKNFRNTIKKYQPKIIIDKLKTCLPSTTQQGRNNFFSARELQEAGVRIRRSSTSSLKDIHFDFNRGILSLPPIIVDDGTATLFLNLIAFEGLHFGAGHEVTDYILLMDGIIDNAKDVEVLKSHDIIDCLLGSDEAVADLFNSISKHITTDDSGNLGEVRWMTNMYCKTRLHRWRASLVETYFRNPWAIISVVAAFFLFALTIIQTVYTAGQYYQK